MTGTTTTTLSRAQVERLLRMTGGARTPEEIGVDFDLTEMRSLARDCEAYMTALEAIADGGCDHYTHAAGRVVHKNCPALIAAAALGRLP